MRNSFFKQCPYTHNPAAILQPLCLELQLTGISFDNKSAGMELNLEEDVTLTHALDSCPTESHTLGKGDLLVDLFTF